MMALDFALSYGDDWCQVPLPLAAHAVCEIQSVVITDCFGEYGPATGGGSVSTRNNVPSRARVRGGCLVV